MKSMLSQAQTHSDNGKNELSNTVKGDECTYVAGGCRHREVPAAGLLHERVTHVGPHLDPAFNDAIDMLTSPRANETNERGGPQVSIATSKQEKTM